MRAFLDIEKARELFRQYEEEHRRGVQHMQGEARDHERSMEIVGERRVNPPLAAGGYDLRDLIR